jgi:hypothetical protein
MLVDLVMILLQIVAGEEFLEIIGKYLLLKLKLNMMPTER